MIQQNFKLILSLFLLQESCYQPPVEAISPTGPEAPGDQMDDLKAVKDELLTKITKVDREIAKTESQIAKLKKKYVCYFHSIPFVTYIYNLLLINFTFFLLHCSKSKKSMQTNLCQIHTMKIQS